MRGLALTTAQYSLLKVEDKDPHPKNWRPQLLICLASHWSKNVIDVRAISLLNMAGQLKVVFVLLYKETTSGWKRFGHFSCLCQRLCGQQFRSWSSERNQSSCAERYGAGKTSWFCQDSLFPTWSGTHPLKYNNLIQIMGCVSGVFQSVGIGGLCPNTVLLNWPNLEDANEVSLFAGAINFFQNHFFPEQIIQGRSNEHCIIMAKGITEFPEPTERLTG